MYLLISKAKQNKEILSIHPDEQNLLLTNKFHFLYIQIFIEPLSFSSDEIFAGTLSLSWIRNPHIFFIYSNHQSDILTFLIFISSLSNFHFLDIQIFAEPAMEVGELTQALLLVNSSVGEVGEAYNNNNNDVVKYNNSLCEVCWYIMCTKSRILRSIATPGPRASIKAPTHLKRFVWLKIPTFCLKWNYKFSKNNTMKLSNFPMWYFFEKCVFWNLCIYSILDKYKQLPLFTFHHKDMAIGYQASWQI